MGKKIKMAFWIVIAAAVCIIAVVLIFPNDTKSEQPPEEEVSSTVMDADQSPMLEPTPQPGSVPEVEASAEPESQLGVIYNKGDKVVFDLDGDGEVETIMLDSRSLIRINGKSAELKYNNKFMIVDLDTDDSYLEIVVERISSDGKMLHFYRFDSLTWTAQYLGGIPTAAEGFSVERGHVLSLCEFSLLPGLKVSVPWKLGADGFEMMEATNEWHYYNIGDNKWHVLDRDIVAYSGLSYDEKSSEPTIIEEGTEIWPLGYHLDGWFKFMDENEEKYWVNLYSPTPIPYPDSYDSGLYYPLGVPMGTSVAADLDGDGVDEVIYQNFNDVPANDLVFTINGVDYSDILDVYTLHRGNYYITDIDKNDGRLEITIYDEGPGADQVVYFYHYAAGKLQYIGNIPYRLEALRFDGDGYVLGAFRLHVLQTWFAGASWRYSDGELQFVQQDFYYALPSNTRIDWVSGEEIAHYYARCDIYVYSSKNLESQPIVLCAGTEFELLGTDNIEWVLLQTLAGEQYWIHASLNNPEGRSDPMEIIAGLSYFD